MIALVFAWLYIRVLVKHSPHAMTRSDVKYFLLWIALGEILGGRIFYILAYWHVYIEYPSQILMLANGGMSPLGSTLGVVVAFVLFSYWRKISILVAGEVVCCAAPIYLFFRRIADYMSGALYGRMASAVLWVMEAVVPFVLLTVLWRRPEIRARNSRAPGILSGVFLAGYGIIRNLGEGVRQPDQALGFLMGG